LACAARPAGAQGGVEAVVERGVHCGFGSEMWDLVRWGDGWVLVVLVWWSGVYIRGVWWAERIGDNSLLLNRMMVL
jgi:hypothetical protein